MWQGMGRSGAAFHIVPVLLVAAAYFAAAKLSLLLAIPPGYATAVWPPSGVALAATLLLGTRIWPGVWLGAALTNLTVQGAPHLAALIAIGNTLEAVAAATWIQRYVASPGRFASAEDVIRFAVCCALSATVAASVGVSQLAVWNVLPWSEFPVNFWTWWQGDASGMLIVAPLILSWAGVAPSRWLPWKAFEAATLAASLTVVAILVFGGETASAGMVRLPLFTLPFILWAAIRFEQRAVTAAVALVCAVAIWYTVLGRGPLNTHSPNESLLLLVAYTSTLAMTGLILSAVISERARALDKLRVSNDLLAQRVEERTRELEEANRALRLDLVERGRQQEVLRQSEERFRMLVDGVKEYAIYLLDANGHVASWNTGAQNLKGYAEDEIVGAHFSRFYTEEDAARNLPEHALDVAREEGRFEDEGWRVRKNGTRFWANAVITALFGPDHRLNGFAKITRDMSARRRIEALQENERQMNEFLAMLSHELRNPLAAIVTTLDLMRSQSGREKATLHDVIARQVAHITHIVEDLLDLSRITHGKIVLKKQLLDLNAVVGHALESCKPLLDNRRLVAECSVAPGEVPVEADATRLSQVILNLISNAAKYTPEQGRISIIVECEGADAVVRVRDTGIGIAPELLPRIFDPFVQGNHSLDRAESGLGIGLTLVRQMVDMHGGSVAAFSDGAGRGSEIVVRLPLATVKGQILQSAPAAHGGPAAARKLLVVDDNRDFADSLAILLEGLGHEVRTAYDGSAVASLVADYRPDIVLLDIGLPGKNGYELARELRGSDGAGRVALIALSGYGQDADRLKVREAGFDHHLVKPVKVDELARIIDALPRGES